MATESIPSSLSTDLRAALVIGLAAALTYSACEGVGLSGGSLAYGSLIAALVVRPDFSRWPLAIYPVLLVLVGLCLAIGVSLGLGLSNVPQVFVFGLVAALMQLITSPSPASCDCSVAWWRWRGCCRCSAHPVGRAGAMNS